MNEEPVQPVKTANSILTQICAVLEQSYKLSNDPDLADKTLALRESIAALPPADITTLLQHIQAMYSACEGMTITRIAFRCDTDGHRVVAVIGIQFGIREIELFAPFDLANAKEMLTEMVGSLRLLEQTQAIILPSGNA